jgi:hypothetical protein
MCNFAESVTGSTAFSYSPIQVNTSAGFIQRYYGDTAATSSIADVFFNLKANWKITLEAGKYPQISFDINGNFCSETESVSQPAYTKARQTPYAVKGATITIAGISFKVISGEIDGTQKQSERVDPSESNAKGQNETTERKITWKAKVYAASSTNALTNLKAQTEGSVSWQWGPTGKAIQFVSSYGQITKITSADQNGVTIWDLEGQCNRNDFTAKINP